MADAALIARLPAILEAHAKWRRGEGGERADLADANLAGAYLARANLAGAYLADANLAGANLAGANLAGANLARANLADANLAGAYLAGAYLADANLADANLAGANLARANLAGAYLADAKGLDAIRGLTFGPVTLPDGPFRAYKLARGPAQMRVIVTLEIPADVARVAPYIGRKCRAASALVLAVTEDASDEGAHREVAEATSWHREGDRPVATYRVGETVVADSFDPSPFVECSHGIHFYLSRREAEDHR